MEKNSLGAYLNIMPQRHCCHKVGNNIFVSSDDSLLRSYTSWQRSHCLVNAEKAEMQKTLAKMDIHSFNLMCIMLSEETCKFLKEECFLKQQPRLPWPSISG